MIHASQFGKGAVRTPQVLKAGHYTVGTPPPVDWSVPFSIEQGFTLHQRDQKSSSSCTAQATCYYSEALDPLHQQFSARYNYSQSFIAGGGAYIWKAMSIPLTKGLASPTSVPDEDSLEITLEDRSLNSQAILEAKSYNYAQVTDDKNIDHLAALVKQYGGFVTGFNGEDDMFDPDGNAHVPLHPVWGHCILITGYEMRNGKKCLKFKNSWTAGWGSNGYGYFDETFVSSGMLFDAYVYASVQDVIKPMTDKEVAGLQALEGYHDASGVLYWTGKPLKDYLKARLADKSTTETQAAQQL